MKRLTRILEKGDIKPRERIMLIIKSGVHRMKTGDDLFHEVDLRALAESWKVNSNAEAREYNKYLEVWKKFKYLRSDMQTLYAHMQIVNANLEKILTLFYYNKDIRKSEEGLKTWVEDNPDNPPFLYLLQNTGLDYKILLHTYTFLSLPENIKEDILLLHEDAKNDYFYWGQEEKLASIIKGKEKLSEEDISELAEMLITSMRWEEEEWLKEMSMPYTQHIFGRNFGPLPLSYLAERLGSVFDIPYENMDELHEHLSRIPYLKEKTRNLLQEEIGNGLFTDCYIPLCNSTSKETYDEDTKLEHKELMKHWLETKDKVTKEIQKYIDNGTFKIKSGIIKGSMFNLPYKIIIGEGLYYGDPKLPFVKEYREHADKLAIYGYLFKVFAESDVYENYEHLLSFKEVSQKLSIVIDEDVTYIAKQYIDTISDELDIQNRYISGLTDQISNETYKDLKYNFYMYSIFDDFRYDLSDLKAKSETSLEKFDEIARQELGYEWKSLGEE